jgi:hypothetical protein
MARPSKLSPDITKRIGENIALGFQYSLAANAAGILYQTLNERLTKGRNSTSGVYFKLSHAMNLSNNINFIGEYDRPEFIKYR